MCTRIEGLRVGAGRGGTLHFVDLDARRLCIGEVESHEHGLVDGELDAGSRLHLQAGVIGLSVDGGCALRIRAVAVDGEERVAGGAVLGEGAEDDSLGCWVNNGVVATTGIVATAALRGFVAKYGNEL